MLFDVVDQVVCGRVVSDSLVWASELLFDGFGELLAELHSPLIVRVDVPNGALHENLVLVEGDERAQSERGDTRQENAIARTIALEDLVLSDLLDLVGRRVRLLHLGLDLGLCLAGHERLGLSQEIGEQDLVVEAAAHRVVCLNRGDEIAWDDLGTLVDELIESVLTVGARLAPNYRSSAVVDLKLFFENIDEVHVVVKLYENYEN